MGNFRKHSVVLRAAISLILIGLLIKFGGIERVSNVLADVQTDFLLFGLSGVAIDRFLMAYRWQILSGAMGEPIPYLRLLRVYFVSGFLGTFIPSSLGTDLLSMLGLSRHTGSRASSVSMVLADRVAGLFSLSLIAAAAAGMAMLYSVLPVPSQWIGAVAVFFGLGCLVIMLSFHSAVRRLVAVIASWLPWHRIGESIRELYNAYHAFGRKPTVLARVVSMAVGNQIISIGATYFFARSIGIDVPFVFYLMAMPLVTVLIMIPVSVGGLGVQEGALAYLLTLAGVPLEQGVGLALLNRMAILATALPGGILYAMGGFSSPQVKGR